MPLDINLSPLYRIQGREQSDMPGALAFQPPKTAARGREQDRLIVYLLLAGNAQVTTGEYRKLAEDVANVYYQAPRAVTSALRAAADWLNKILLERNLATTGSGQYTLAFMTLAVLRESQCIFSINGPMHAYWFGAGGSRHIFEPAISGKGLGSSQSVAIHYGQADLAPNDLLLICGRVPNAWNAPLEGAQSASLEAMRRRLIALTNEDLNAVLVQTTEGNGAINFYKKGMDTTPEVEQIPAPLPTPPPASDSNPGLPASPEPESAPEAHLLQPSAYAIPRQPEATPPTPQPAADPLASLPHRTTPREFPASIPRANPQPPAEEPEPEETEPEADIPAPEPPKAITPSEPQQPSPQAKRAAKTIVNFMQGFRHGSASLGERLRNFLPRLLPASETPEVRPVSADSFMAFMAILIPLIVATIAMVVYLRYGRNEQYDAYYNQALEMKTQALAVADPVEQRIAWENVLLNLDQAEAHNVTNDTINLRGEAQAHLDQLLGIARLKFNPAFSSKPGIEISRMAAAGNDLYLLNAANGEVLRALPSGGGGFELDTTFNCKPGNGLAVGPLVDILALPITNIYDAAVLGIDAGGNLLYCRPGFVPQSALLPAPDTNWTRITSFILDGGNLYVLDAPARAVWVYPGKEAAFVDRPYFFFGQQTPTQDAIDFLVSGDEMYLLHADGRVSACVYSRLDTAASKCADPLNKQNPFPAYAGEDLFAAAHFTQILYAAPPDPSILLLDSEGHNVMRFTARTLELQNQFQPVTGGGNSLPSEPAAAVAVSPDHVLYLAVDGQVYFAVNMP